MYKCESQAMQRKGKMHGCCCVQGRSRREKKVVVIVPRKERSGDRNAHIQGYKF